MSDATNTAHTTRSWIFHAALLVLFWGIWGAFSALPAQKYGYPDEMIYSIRALTMGPAYLIRARRDRRNGGIHSHFSRET